MQYPEIIAWDIYEIKTAHTEIHGVMLRGRIRKLGLEKHFNVLCENAADAENAVRFAVTEVKNAQTITEYLEHIIPDVTVELVLEQIKNPVLSKLKVNKQERYTL